MKKSEDKTEKEIDKKEVEETTYKKKDYSRKCKTGNGCIYGLGFIGSAIFFIGKASSFGAGVVGFLKAIVWPAIMTYEVFNYLIK